MYQASFEKITLNFKLPAGTSRGILKSKNSWIIKIWRTEDPSFVGIGEASIIENLSPEWNENYENVLSDTLVDVSSHIKSNFIHLKDYPSIRFGLESALLNLHHALENVYFPSNFTRENGSIKINGLIWMGDKEFMYDQIKKKLDDGFDCIKMKIGAIDFESEMDLLKYIRSKFSKESVELRVDANGAFSVDTVYQKLNKISTFDIHSIEQPIAKGQWDEMSELCANTPLPIALDEELIGVKEIDSKLLLLSTIKPQYIILKPSLLGGFSASDEWIKIADSYNIKWWLTSALESNVGLNAIAQYAFTKNNPLPQGLGTGQLFTNNTLSPLVLKSDQLNFKA